MRHLTSANYRDFIEAASVAVIHFDAEWDAQYRDIMRRKMLEAEQALGSDAEFAEVDCDRNTDLAKATAVMNVPTVAYYRRGELIAALIGLNQDVRSRAERVIRGESVGSSDGLDQ